MAEADVTTDTSSTETNKFFSVIKFLISTKNRGLGNINDGRGIIISSKLAAPGILEDYVLSYSSNIALHFVIEGPESWALPAQFKIMFSALMIVVISKASNS